jgi:hypothetical protein
MLTDGFISLYRSILKWEWYDNINTTRLFLHLLLTVNYYDEKWHGIEIKRGQLVTSTAKLSKETRLSPRQVRVATTHLISTNEVTSVTSSKGTIITVLQYDKYQQMTNDMANERQTNDKLVTNERQLINKAIKQKSNKAIINTYSFDFIPEYIKQDILDFMEYRKGIKAPMSEKAVRLLLKKLFALSDQAEDQKKILEQSILNNWKGIFELKGNNQQSTLERLKNL